MKINVVELHSTNSVVKMAEGHCQIYKTYLFLKQVPGFHTYIFFLRIYIYSDSLKIADYFIETITEIDKHCVDRHQSQPSSRRQFEYLI